MALVLKAGAEFTWHWLEAGWNYADPRSAHLPLVRNPLGVATILGLYLFFVCSLGPRLMRHRKAFDLHTPMIVYNAVQVVCCVYLFVQGVRLAWGGTYSYLCEPLSTTMDPHDFEVAALVHSYFVLKIVDLLDTVFMVLRKSFRQISFLHIYHHAGMVFAIWLAVKIYPGGHHTLLGVINSLVHCLLYGYYFVTLYEPRAKSAWWKKYITVAQIVQFGLNVLHEAVALMTPNCEVDKRINAVLVVQNLFMFALFTEFYVKNYTKKECLAEKKDT